MAGSYFQQRLVIELRGRLAATFAEEHLLVAFLRVEIYFRGSIPTSDHNLVQFWVP